MIFVGASKDGQCMFIASMKVYAILEQLLMFNGIYSSLNQWLKPNIYWKTKDGQVVLNYYTTIKYYLLL